MVSEGVEILQSALARDRLGEYQAQAAIAALHDDAATAEETDWTQILEWYDDLARLSRLAGGRAQPRRRCRRGRWTTRRTATGRTRPGLPRFDAVAAYLHERAGNRKEAARLYKAAADATAILAEHAHLLKQAARLNRG